MFVNSVTIIYKYLNLNSPRIKQKQLQLKNNIYISIASTTLDNRSDISSVDSLADVRFLIASVNASKNAPDLVEVLNERSVDDEARLDGGVDEVAKGREVDATESVVADEEGSDASQTFEGSGLQALHAIAIQPQRLEPLHAPEYSPRQGDETVSAQIQFVNFSQTAEDVGAQRSYIVSREIQKIDVTEAVESPGGNIVELVRVERQSLELPKTSEDVSPQDDSVVRQIELSEVRQALPHGRVQSGDEVVIQKKSLEARERRERAILDVAYEVVLEIEIR